MTSIKDNPQMDMSERIIDNPDLSGLLIERNKRKSSQKAVKATFDEADSKVQAALDELQVDDVTLNEWLTEEDGRRVRIGQFTLTASAVPAGHRAFDTKARVTRHIKAPDEG